jgi:hypothetical protein
VGKEEEGWDVDGLGLVVVAAGNYPQAPHSFTSRVRMGGTKKKFEVTGLNLDLRVAQIERAKLFSELPRSLRETNELTWECYHRLLYHSRLVLVTATSEKLST